MHSTLSHANNLRAETARLIAQLRDKQNELDHLIKLCCHQWGPTKEAHIYYEGYTIPGDEPGTMGVDWRGPIYVSPRTKMRWKRVRKICGHEEFTTRTTETMTKHPAF